MANEAKISLLLDMKDKMGSGLSSANKGLEGFKKRVENMQPAFSKMAKVGTAALLGIGAAVGVTVKAYQEQERAEKRLEQIATQVTGATKQQIQGFKDQAAALQQVGVVGDEVLIAGQSQISSFTKSSEVVSELSDDLADLAVATYGTNVSQEQSIQTANLLGRALQGQLGALTRTGILVNDDFKAAFEAANTEQERAVVLSQIIQDNYGGVNQAMRETSEGGMRALQNSLGDINENIGAAFIPALNGIVEKVQPIVESFGEWAKNNPELITQITSIALGVAGATAAIGGIGLAIPKVIGAVQGMIGGVKALGAALTFLATNPIGIIITALAAIGIALVTLYNENKDFQITVDRLWANVVTMWQNAGRSFEIFVKQIQGQLMIWKGDFELAVAKIQIEMAKLNPAMSGMVNEMEQIYDNHAQNLEQDISKHYDSIETLQRDNQKTEKTNLENHLAKLKSDYETAGVEHKKTILKHINQMEEEGKKKFASFRVGTTAELEKMRGEAVAKGAAMAVQLGQAGAQMMNNLIGNIENRIPALVGVYNKMKNSLPSFSTTVSIAQRVVQSVIKARAAGGNVNPQSSYMVGEHRPEMFVPSGYGRIEPRPGGGSGVTVNVSGNSFYGEGDLAQRVGKALVKELRTKLLLNQS